MLQKARTHLQPVPEAIENEVICMRLARSIIDDFASVPEEHPKYTFPFLHYLSSATIIALGIIIKQPSFKHTYAALTLEAARSLKKHCARTWVSGKMAQTVWKLNQMAEAALTVDNAPPEAIEDLSHNRFTHHFTRGPRPAFNTAQSQQSFVPIGPPPTVTKIVMPDIALNEPPEIEQDLSIPDEMVDGGMEWLQALFADGLDTHLLPVWD
jgi:hypothetical protein